MRSALMPTGNETGRLAKGGPVSTRAKMRCPGSAIFCAWAWEETGRTFHLSHRELEIVRGFFDGNKEYAIAYDLGISPHTVHTHIRRMYAKMVVRNHGELLARTMTAFLSLPPCPAGQIPPNLPLSGRRALPARLKSLHAALGVTWLGDFR